MYQEAKAGMYDYDAEDDYYPEDGQGDDGYYAEEYYPEDGDGNGNYGQGQGDGYDDEQQLKQAIDASLQEAYGEEVPQKEKKQKKPKKPKKPQPTEESIQSIVSYFADMDKGQKKGAKVFKVTAEYVKQQLIHYELDVDKAMANIKYNKQKKEKKEPGQPDKQQQQINQGKSAEKPVVLAKPKKKKVSPE